MLVLICKSLAQFLAPVISRFIVCSGTKKREKVISREFRDESNFYLSSLFLFLSFSFASY